MGIALIFASSTILTNLLIYMSNASWANFFLEGAGLPNLFRYVLVTVLACVAYGGIFTADGPVLQESRDPGDRDRRMGSVLFRASGEPAETHGHALSSVVAAADHRQRTVFRSWSDASSALFSVLGPPSVAALLVWASGKVLYRTEVTWTAPSSAAGQE